MPFEPPPFRPPFWAAGPHVQTLAARMLRSARGPAMVRERWELRDGDFLDVDVGPDPGPGAPLVLVLHGLEGSSRRRYVLSACRELLGLGLRPVAMNLRGCSGTMNRRPRFYHSGETHDPTFVLEGLRRAFPHRRVGALGFSLGGNALLKLLGERPDGGVGLVDAA
ncbi:MAG TPA: alpha/beta fold hydrolase, partial [Longimicrobiales bacterium]|nr:alpha/beta fold hydrolase [Longimicrobiales bacterium]